MKSENIVLEIFDGIEKAINKGYTRLYVNMDDQDNGTGQLRVLAMKIPEDIILFDGIFDLTTCREVLALLGQSQYDIKDFTSVLWSDGNERI